MNLRILVLALLPVVVAAQQRFSFGVQGGVQAEAPVLQAGSVPFAAGASLNVHIISRLSFEPGVLFTRLGSGHNQSAFLYPENSVTLTFENWRGRAVEIPLLAKYRFRNERGNWRPFVTAGPTVRWTSLRSDYFTSVFSGAPASSGGPLLKVKNTEWNVDPAAGVGVDFRAGRFHLEPEARYSYWAAGEHGRIRKNQVTLLLGFRF
jgi:hypothetical protein